MAEHVELERSSENKPKWTRQIDKNISHTFQKILNSRETQRNVATNMLVKMLTEKQRSASKDELCFEVKYSLGRLVQGLASSQPNTARQGYSVTLCQMLLNFPEVTTEMVLQTVKERLGINKKHDSQLEIGSTLIGRAFAYLAIIQCGRLNSANVSEILKDVLEIRKKKSYLTEIGTQAVVLIAQKTDSKTFKTLVWPEIKEELSSGWEGCRPETLHLLMACNSYQPTVVKLKFMKLHWEGQIFNEENFENLVNVLAKCHRDYPGIHTLITAISEELIKFPLILDSLWPVINAKLLTDSLPKKTIAMNLCLILLQSSVSAQQAANFVTPALCQILMKALPDKKKELHNICTEVVKKIIIEVENTKDGGLQYRLIRHMVKCFGTAMFEFQTLNTTISRLIHTIPSDGAKMLKEDLFKTVDGENVFFAKPIENTDKVIVWALGHIRNLVTSPACATDDSWQINLLQFLFVKSFFFVKQPVKALPHCEIKWEKNFTDPVQHACVDCFQKALNNLASFQPVATKKKDLSQYLNTMFSIVQYAKLLLQNEEFVSLKNPISVEMRKAWNKAVRFSETIHKTRKGCVEFDKHGAFELLLLFSCLQLFNSDPAETIELLQDVQICYEKACSRLKKLEMRSEEPKWIEVITELLISMLVQPSHLARVIVLAVFSSLVSHITRDAVGVIVNVLQPNIEVENLKDSNEEYSEEENEEKEDSEDSEIEMDSTLRQTIKSALGEAAVSENDEDDLEDLSDAEMFKRDVILAEAFKSMSKAKNKEEDKAKQRQMVVFKSKYVEAWKRDDYSTLVKKTGNFTAIDLLEIVVKERPTAGIIQDIIVTLLNLIESGVRNKEEKVLGEKSRHICRQLLKAKIIPDKTVEPDELFTVIKELLRFSEKVLGGIDVVRLISDAVLLLNNLFVSCAPVQTESEAESDTKLDKSDVKPDKSKVEDDEQKSNGELYRTKVFKIIQTKLTKILPRRISNSKVDFYQCMFRKQPVYFWPMYETLLNIMKDDNVKVFHRTKACNLMASLMNKQIRAEVGDESLEEFSTEFLDFMKSTDVKTQKIQVPHIGIQPIQSCLTELCEELSKPEGELKPKFVESILGVFSQYITCIKGDVEKTVKEDLQKTLTSLRNSSATSYVKKSVRRVMKQLDSKRYLQKIMKQRERRKRNSLSHVEGPPEKQIKTEPVDDTSDSS